MKRIAVMIFVLMMLLPAAAQAHIVNESNLYDDIAFSEARENIVYLSGLGVIPYEHGAPLFKPKDKLSRSDLAYWAGSFRGLGAQQSDPQAVRQAVLAEGGVPSLDGNATVRDVNQAYFQGRAELNGSEELTREQFASLMAVYLTTKVNGQTLFEQAGYSPGPSGTVEAVAMKESQGADGKTVRTYAVTIQGVTLELSEHPRILYAPVDPGLWKGKSIRESWVMNKREGGQQLQLISFVKPAGAASSPQEANSDEKGQAHAHHMCQEGDSDCAPAGEGAGFPVIPAAAGAVAAVLLCWLLIKKRA